MATKSKEPLKYQVGWLAALFASNTDYQSISLADDRVILSGHEDGLNKVPYLAIGVGVAIEQGFFWNILAVHLEDGTVIKADIVCMAVGIRPNADLAKAAGLETNRGIIVQDDMKTSDPNIYAVGECVEHNGLCYGLVAPLYEMAAVVAKGLAGQVAKYQSTISPTKLKVTGIDLFSAGKFESQSGREEITLKSSAGDFYKKLVIENNKIIGVVLFGNTADGAWFFDLLKQGVDINAMRQSLVFGKTYEGEEPLAPYGGQCSLTA